ncbi:hypothetical protein BYT27DRAFT_7208724 [Phlegmacium glaucopus]|nr:hypothetical protein BYT27DRAFT_7208724 [Phlegmacium glaucopus]
MPSESSFKKQVQAAHNTLLNFKTVLPLKTLLLTKPALLKLINSTAAFANFVPFFLTHPLFQEVLPAVHNTIEDFKSKNPDFRLPEDAHKIVNLDTELLACRLGLVQIVTRNFSLPVSANIFLKTFVTLTNILLDSGSNIPMDVDPQHPLPISSAHLCGSVNTGHPSGPISGPNLDLMQCSRTILSDPIMSKLIDKDPKSPKVLKESLCTQIVVTCQHLHIHLSIIDRLMSLYITSSEETPTPD